MTAEFDLIGILRARCAVSRADVRLGIGDDAAVVTVPADHELVICTDTLVEGVHFPLMTRAADIGWKSLAVNLSDLAAMGATPAWATLALTLPSADADFVAAFADGFGELAAQHHVALIGGDTTRGPMTISVTAHGFVAPGKALRRDGARVGDQVFVTGSLGDAAAGLRYLARQGNLSHGELRDDLVERLNRPQPRVAAGAVLRNFASACVDVSDGLVADLGHVAAQSGIGIMIDTALLPASPALLAVFSDELRLNMQLAGGDDYELAFTVAEAAVDEMLRDLSRIGCGVTRIGVVVEGAGVQVFDHAGNPHELMKRGWEHFT